MIATCAFLTCSLKKVIFWKEKKKDMTRVRKREGKKILDVKTLGRNTDIIINIREFSIQGK